MRPVIPTVRPWHRRVLDALLDHLLAPAGNVTSLRELDPRTLADIGVHPSEIGSIEAESRGPRHAVTRRRILAGARA
jgi:uncharacterized protein YjiS (DUF1127 family)